MGLALTTDRIATERAIFRRRENHEAYETHLRDVEEAVREAETTLRAIYANPEIRAVLDGLPKLGPQVTKVTARLCALNK